MRTRTLIDLLSLSSNLYLIARDEELMKHLKEWSAQARKKATEVWDDLGDEGEEDAELLERILKRVKNAREEFDRKVAETAEKVYKKMHLAHENDVKALENKVEELKRELALAEARIIKLETGSKH